MRSSRIFATTPLFAAAALACATVGVTMAAPAQAAPCAQRGFPGDVTFTNPGGVALRFSSKGSGAGGPAQFNPNGIFKNGTVAGGITPDGQLTVTFTDDDVDDPGSATVLGTVNPDGTVKVTNSTGRCRASSSV